MKGNLEIIKAGLMTSIQDLGREGLAYYAIPHSGAMDANAAKIALLLLNKNINDALIECTSVAPTIKFNHQTKISLAGADFKWKLNGVNIPVNSCFAVNAGDILSGQFAEKGLRGYIATEGKLDVEEAFGSFSTYINAKIGGHNGRLLRKGDIIEWTGSNTDADTHLLQKGPEYNWLTQEAKNILESEDFYVGRDTDRMGIRLEGKALESKNYHLPASAPVLPGFVQLPPNGFPIVVLQDSQLTGGYPRIAYLKIEFLSKLNQVPIGGRLKFKVVK